MSGSAKSSLASVVGASRKDRRSPPEREVVERPVAAHQVPEPITSCIYGVWG